MHFSDGPTAAGNSPSERIEDWRARVARVRSIVSGLQRYRASLHVGTESHRAANAAALQAERTLRGMELTLVAMETQRPADPGAEFERDWIIQRFIVRGMPLGWNRGTLRS